MAANNEKPVEAHYKLPSDKVLQQAGELQIHAADNSTIRFQDLYSGKSENSRQLVVFIRHFYCGHCEEYIRALMRTLPPATLARADITLTVIGCGESECIADYRARTNCEYAMYCDPTRALYRTLGMEARLAGSRKPDYVTIPLATSVFRSIMTGISAGRKGLSGGKVSQNGGEWLFQGANGQLVWCHRMRDTVDHAEMKELEQVLGVEGERQG